MIKRRTHEEFIQKMNEKHPEIEVLGTYVNSRTKIEVLCKICGHKWETKANNLMRGTSCPVCYRVGNRKTHAQFLTELFEVNDKANTFDILEEYTTSHTKLLCKCKICNYEWKTKPITLLDDKSACPVCANRIIVHGVNDIATLKPDLLKYFVNQEEAKCHAPYSNHKSLLKCPDCGAEKYMGLDMLSARGFSCNICNDKISYPNKYLRGFLKQLPVSNVIYEYSPSWIKPYRYDVYFEYNNNAYIIEMDGGLGHGKYKYNSQEKDTEGLERDKIKDKKALDNNIIVIRIDCLKSDSEYISNNIKNSLLNDVFDLSSVDWSECDKFATKNIIKEVCDYFSETNLSVHMIAKNFSTSENAIRRYLKSGTKFGWCYYNPNLNKNKKQLANTKTNKNIQPMNSNNDDYEKYKILNFEYAS